ncbi:MAG: GGDEF domain-containing phosphodiesterase [Lachnospiraceae bacterium]
MANKKTPAKRQKKRRIPEYKIIRLSAVCLVLFLISVGICGFHIYSAIHTCGQLAYDSVYSQAQFGAQVLGRTLEKNCQVMRLEAENFSKSKVKTEADILETLSEFKQKELFDQVFYLDLSGTLYDTTGEVSSADLSSLMAELNAAETKDVYVDKQFFEENIAFSLIAPIVTDGIVRGYVIGADQTEKLFDGLNSGYLMQVAEGYLIDDNGVVIASTEVSEEQAIRHSNFYMQIMAHISDEGKAADFESSLRQSLAAGEAGSMKVEPDDGGIYLFYMPLPKTEGVNLIYRVSRSEINRLVSPAVLEAVVCAVGLILLLLFLANAVKKFVSEDQKQIAKLVYRDVLTDAPNENHFKMKASELLKEYRELPYVIICFDILNFRYINEGYGHQKADLLLRAMVEASRESFSYNETFARISADCFICLAVNDGRDRERKRFLEDRLSKAASAIHMTYPVRIKSGYYTVNDYEEDISGMMDKANLARKSVNTNSKDLVGGYQESLMEETRKREDVESKMEAALEAGEFVPYLQPKWNMKEDKIAGAEALVRWRKRDGQIIPPNEFIPIFEKNGFIEKIDFYMLERICGYLRQMLDEGRTVYPVSINQSRYLLHDPGYTLHVQQILLKYKIPKGLVELELTETVFFHERERMLDVMKQLKELNMELSIDDFGSGYSSLNLLRDMPFDVLKIDRGFLDKTETSDPGKWILRKIVEMAEGLGVRVICEGVETPEQVKMLLEIGCIYAQGFLYSRPVPIETFIEKYNMGKDNECGELSERIG